MRNNRKIEKQVVATDLSEGAKAVAFTIIKDIAVNSDKITAKIKEASDGLENVSPLLRDVSLFMEGAEYGFALAVEMITKGDLDITIIKRDKP